MELAYRMGLPPKFMKEILRNIGIYSPDWIAKNVPDLVSLSQVKLTGVAEHYDNPDKKRHRDYIVCQIGESLEGETVRYLGLPHVAMLDYLQAARAYKVSAQDSLAVERKDVIFYIMQSWVTHHNLFPDGQLLKGLRLFHGRLSSALVQVEGNYNFVNFDFVGPWTSEVEASVVNLFSYGRAAERAVFAITLAESTRWIENPQYTFVEDFHQHFVKERVQAIAKKYGYSATYLWHQRYKEGTVYPMITIMFLVRKKKKASNTS